MSNYVIIVSEDIEVYKSLKRAFRVSNIVVQEWENYVRNKQILKSYPIGIFTQDRDSLYTWIWNDIRGHNKLLNPIVVVSFHSLDPSNDLRDLVFEKNFETYRYFKIPFLLEDVFQSCKELKSLRNEKERRYDVRSFSQPSGLLNKVEHELISLLGSEEEAEMKKERAMSFYTRVKEILQDLDFKNKLIAEVEECTSMVKTSTMSDQECRNFKLITKNLFSKILNEL